MSQQARTGMLVMLGPDKGCIKASRFIIVITHVPPLNSYELGITGVLP